MLEILILQSSNENAIVIITSTLGRLNISGINFCDLSSEFPKIREIMPTQNVMNRPIDPN